MKKKAFLSLLLILSLLMCMAAPACAEEEFMKLYAMPTTLLDGTLVGASQLEDGRYGIMYQNASRDDLAYYLMLNSLACNFAMPAGEDVFQCYIPGIDEQGAIGYFAEEKVLFITVSEDTATLGDDSLAGYIALLGSDITLPADATGIAAPQFYAAVSRQPYRTGLTGKDENSMQWTEYYDGIGWDELSHYTMLMTMFGFQVYAVDRVVEEDMDILMLVYLNGDAEITVAHEANDGTAIVSYKPGVSYYLLDGSQLNDALQAAQ